MTWTWKETTDDDFPVAKGTAEYLLTGMLASNAGQAEVVFRGDDDDPISGLTVAISPIDPEVAVAVHINFRTGDVVTAWRIADA